MTDTDPPPDAAAALAIIERERARTGRAITPNVVLMHVVWGLAYLVAGVVYYLYLDGMLGGLATTVIAVVVGAAAIATSIVASVRSTRGVRTAADTTAAMFGFAWLIGLVLTAVLTIGARNVVLTPVLYVFVVGLLTLLAGVVWINATQFAGGAVIMVVAAVAIFVPSPAHILVLSIGGGGAFLVIGAWFAMRAPRP